MSEQDVALKVAEILKKPLREAAEGAADLRMKELPGIVQKEMEGLPGIVQKEMEGLPGIVRKEMDACIDGKCDVIADKVLEKLPKAGASMAVEDITKAVKEAMEGSTTPFNVEGHSAHDILDCPTCKPIVMEKLWENKEYRLVMAEKVCEDEECRNLFLKHFEEKGHGSKENGGSGGAEESWADRRLRERSTE